MTASGRPVSHAVAAAMRAVPRHLFLPDLPPPMAYRNEAIVTRRDADGQPTSSSSQPTIMAYMLDQLGVTAGQRVLEIGPAPATTRRCSSSWSTRGEACPSTWTRTWPGRRRRTWPRPGCPEVIVVQADGAALARRGPVRPDHRHGRGQRSRARLAGPARAQRADRRPAGPGGSQCSVALEWDGACWQSRSVVPCGFMRMRGTLAGPERTLVTGDNQKLALTLPGGRDLDVTAVARALNDPAGPTAERATRVAAGPAQLFDGLGLWLALNEPRWGVVSESVRVPGGLARAPLFAMDRRMTAASSTRRDSPSWPGPPAGRQAPPGQAPPGQAPPGPGSPRAGSGSGLRAQRARLGLPPDLAAGLAAQVQAWGRRRAPARATSGSAPIPAAPVRGPPGRRPAGAVIERPHTTFVVRAA